MFQFKKEENALQAARLLAIRNMTPIVVMSRAGLNVFSIGHPNSAAVLAAGKHVATVFGSGHVDYPSVGHHVTDNNL